MEEECQEEEGTGRLLAPPVLPGALTLRVDVPGHLPSVVEGAQPGRAGAVVTVRVPLDLGATLTGLARGPLTTEALGPHAVRTTIALQIAASLANRDLVVVVDPP